MQIYNKKRQFRESFLFISCQEKQTDIILSDSSGLRNGFLVILNMLQLHEFEKLLETATTNVFSPWNKYPVNKILLRLESQPQFFYL